MTTTKQIPATAKNMVAGAAPTTTLPPTATYAEAYAVLSAIAERLRTTGSTANIDRLSADLRAARAAHALCRDRLAAIRSEIDLEVAAVHEDEGHIP